MWKTVIPRGMKLVGTAAGTAAGAVGVAPTEAECRAAHSVGSSSTQLGKHDNLKLVMDNESDLDSWELCGEEELTQACYDVFGRKPRLLDIDGEMYRGSQPVLSHDLMDEVDSIESIGKEADRLMDSMHYDNQSAGPADQMQAFADATMYLVSKPNVQRVVMDEIESDAYFRQRMELLLNGFQQPMLPPSAQNILINDLSVNEVDNNTDEGPIKKVLRAVSGTLHKIGDAINSVGNALGGMFHNLANKIRKQLNMEEGQVGDGMMAGIGAVTFLATAIILIVVARRAGVPVPRRV